MQAVREELFFEASGIADGGGHQYYFWIASYPEILRSFNIWSWGILYGSSLSMGQVRRHRKSDDAIFEIAFNCLKLPVRFMQRWQA